MEAMLIFPKIIVRRVGISFSVFPGGKPIVKRYL
jgi:hypothetical protein